jgi:hypothetical protein
MRNSKSLIGLWLCALAVPAGSLAAGQPTDVPSNHWAARPVQEVLQNDVMTPTASGRFQGDALVTRTQAVIALAKLARALEDGTWHRAASVPVTNKAVKTLQQGDWKQRPVTRYTLAAVLARTGDYVANGLPRPASDAKDLGKSITLKKVSVTVSRTNPAYDSLTYLADRRMIAPDSPLLKSDGRPVHGDELSRAITEMVVGLNDRLTPLGLDAEGNSPDASFHQKRPSGKP